MGVGSLKVKDAATGEWVDIATVGPPGVAGPAGEQGEQGPPGPAGGAFVRYRSAYINTWTTDVSGTALKAVFEDSVQIDDPTGDWMLVAGLRCISDAGSIAGQVQIETKAGAYTAPTHTVIAGSPEAALWGGVSRIWFPLGSQIAAAPGPVTVSMKIISNVGERTVYDPSLVLVQLNSETAAATGAWADATLESGVTGAFKYKVSGGVCSVSFDITRATNLLPGEVITTLPVGARPPAQAFLFSDIGGNLGVRSLVRVEPDGTVHSPLGVSMSGGMRGNGTFGTA